MECGLFIMLFFLIVILSDKQWEWHHVPSMDILGRGASCVANLPHRTGEMGSNERWNWQVSLHCSLFLFYFCQYLFFSFFEQWDKISFRAFLSSSQRVTVKIFQATLYSLNLYFIKKTNKQRLANEQAEITMCLPVPTRDKTTDSACKESRVWSRG